AIAAFLGLLLPPALIITVLGIIYAHLGNAPALQRTLAGIACAAVGLFLAVIVRMMGPLLNRRNPVELALMAGVFVAVGLLRWPLSWVMLAAVPVSVFGTYLWRRRVVKA